MGVSAIGPATTLATTVRSLPDPPKQADVRMFEGTRLEGHVQMLLRLSREEGVSHDGGCWRGGLESVSDAEA